MKTILLLTDQGKHKAEEIAGSGPKQAILAALYEHGSTDLETLAVDAGLEEEKAVATIQKLIESGYVRESTN